MPGPRSVRDPFLRAVRQHRPVWQGRVAGWGVSASVAAIPFLAAAAAAGPPESPEAVGVGPWRALAGQAEAWEVPGVAQASKVPGAAQPAAPLGAEQPAAEGVGRTALGAWGRKGLVRRGEVSASWALAAPR